ncbi:MAG: methionine--tRNA ligase [Candidatus Thermoplasmatota archaeon]|nr:methionine--tRNA ligase [Candidatus Thermoplasmatota archaeon]
MKRILIGVAWPYANGPIHIGQVGGCYLPPDIFRRYHKMKGNEVLMVSGSDQHGTPVTVTAEEEGLTPKETAEKYHQINSKALKDLGVDFTLFTYTMNDTHKRVARDIFKTLYEKDHIYMDTMETFYCPHCEKFLPDRYVIGTCPECGQEEIDGDQCDECGALLDPEDLIEPECKHCGGRPELKESEHFFLRLSAFQEKLEEYVEDKDHWKNHVLNFTKGWLDEGLEDRPISRDMEWGIPVPVEGYEEKKIYVWFEAVIGYLSTSIKWSEETDGDWTKFWKDPDAEHYYFLAKDNIPFHTIIWPAMLMGYDEDLNLPYDVPANQYMRLGGEQFSTSRGIIVSLPDVLRDFDSDAVRYYITTIMPETKDTNFTWDEFQEKINSELVGNLGNFIHRVLSFTHSNFDETPEAGELEERDTEVIEEIEKRVEAISEKLEGRKFNKGLKELTALSRTGNKYFNDKAPWEEVDEDKESAGTTINISLRIVKALCVTGAPYLPDSMDELWVYLEQEGSVHEQDWKEAIEPIETGIELDEPEPLYEKIDLSEMREETDLRNSLERLDLRVGEISKVQEHPNADKLYICRVDMGEEERTLVAGLKPYYDKEQMEDKKIAVVANLEPAKLRGIESEGMMLAAQSDDKVSLLEPRGNVGENIKGTGPGAEMISFDDFEEYELKTVKKEDGKIIADDVVNLIDAETFKAKEEEEEEEGKEVERVGVALIDDEDNALLLKDSEGVVRLDEELPPGSEVM